MKLYMHPVSMTSRPVRLFIAEKGIAVDQEIVDLQFGEGRFRLLAPRRMPDRRAPRQQRHIAPAQQKPGDIGQCVPAQVEAQIQAEHVERADGEQDRVDEIEAGWTVLHGRIRKLDAGVTQGRVALLRSAPHIGDCETH